MSHLQGCFPIIEAEQLNDKGYRLTVCCPEITKIAKAGQFVHIKCDGHFLRRPISICAINPNAGTLALVFEVRGEGTDWLSGRKKGDFLDMIAPLGNGFSLRDEAKKVLLVGGGIGTPPMLELAKQYGNKATVIIGFRDEKAILLEQDFLATGARLLIATDDGSKGHHGFVTDLVMQEISDAGAVYACGPTPMLKAVGRLALERDCFCELSLEERMGCGVGACLVCVCKTKEADGEHHRCVCKDGPVFQAKEVLF